MGERHPFDIEASEVLDVACYESCGNISSYSGWLCGDEHMEPWIIALLQHATAADLQGSQGGSHVIVPKTYNEQPTQPHFYVGVPSKKNF